MLATYNDPSHDCFRTANYFDKKNIATLGHAKLYGDILFKALKFINLDNNMHLPA